MDICPRQWTHNWIYIATNLLIIVSRRSINSFHFLRLSSCPSSKIRRWGFRTCRPDIRSIVRSNLVFSLQNFINIIHFGVIGISSCVISLFQQVSQSLRIWDGPIHVIARIPLVVLGEFWNISCLDFGTI